MKIEGIKTKSYKKNKLKILSVFAIILLLLFILFDYVFIVRRSYKALAPNIADTSEQVNDSTKNNPDTNQAENTNADSNPATTPDTTSSGNFDNKGNEPVITPSPTVVDNSSTDPYYYYDLGRQEFAKNNCQSAIDYFDKAISINSMNPNFYIKKSEAQIALNLKQAAINTINQGLTQLPNNDLLLSQLDFIQNVVK